jgi:hypothetical protein
MGDYYSPSHMKKWDDWLKKKKGSESAGIGASRVHSGGKRKHAGDEGQCPRLGMKSSPSNPAPDIPYGMDVGWLIRKHQINNMIAKGIIKIDFRRWNKTK